MSVEVDHRPHGAHMGESIPVTGIIYPPPDIRKMIDKAAANLATKGPELEIHIRETNKDGRFNFLNPNDPYYAYYRFKYQEFKEGRAPQKDAPTEHNEERIVEQPANLAPKEPQPFEFSATMPAMSAQDLDIMKLTAQFAARNGRAFIGQLAQRESRNYQFDFLRPSHSLFPYFTELVKQYTKIFLPPKDLQEKLKANTDDKYRILERVKERVEWVAWQEAEKKKKNDEDEKERIAYASIDWHDFVVVETVEFTEADENADLPPPMSLSELENMSLAQKRMASMVEPVQFDTKVEMEVDDVDMDESDEETHVSHPPLPKIPDTTAPIKIRTDYKAKLLGSTASKASVPVEICSRCGEAIPVNEMNEHLRIELLDPKWKEQKMAMEAKKKDSNLLQTGTDISRILSNFSSVRADIFDSDEIEATKKIKEQEEEAKKKNRVIWDGHTATMGLANQRAQKTHIEDQIAQMHRRIGGTSEDIGPHIPGQQMEPPKMAPPIAYSAPQYYNTNIHPGYGSQAPGIYGMNGGVPMNGPPPAAPFMAPPPPMSAPPPASQFSPSPMIPAVRKAEEPEGGSDKRFKTENEAEWQMNQIPTFSVIIQTPDLPDKPEWGLTGNNISIAGLVPNTLISTLKDRIASQIGMPAGKQKLSTSTTNTVLNNSKTLSFYGIMEGTSLVLELRKR
ncbi:Pre-mRNA splicing factor PRP21 like protein-domain-containing protein [Pilobolus umbonatus]|nr:Pre-mRNA splicing factor PRP21 like protein-domain-containing protein [Pilobolus umbonatus]